MERLRINGQLAGGQFLSFLRQPSALMIIREPLLYVPPVWHDQKSDLRLGKNGARVTYQGRRIIFVLSNNVLSTWSNRRG